MPFSEPASHQNKKEDYFLYLANLFELRLPFNKNLFLLPEACSASKSRTFSERPTISTADTRTENLEPVLQR